MRRIGATLRQLAKSPWAEAKILFDFLLYQLGRKPMTMKRQVDIKPTTVKKPRNKKFLKVTTKECPPPK